MLRNKQNNGQAVLIIVIVLVILAVIYLASDPVKTKVDIAYKEATTWTADNIRKDPVGYLTWAIKQVETLETNIDSRNLALETEKGKLETGLKENKTNYENYSAFLKDAKTAYNNASQDKSFPVEVRGYQLNENQLKEKIVEAHQNAERFEKLAQVYENTKRSLEVKIKELADKKAEIKNLKVKLGTDLEIAKVKNTISDLPEISTSLSSIQNTTNALSKLNGYSNSEKIPTLSEMINQSSKSYLDEEFEKIMGK